jgi:hypothetical protein
VLLATDSRPDNLSPPALSYSGTAGMIGVYDRRSLCDLGVAPNPDVHRLSRQIRSSHRQCASMRIGPPSRRISLSSQSISGSVFRLAQEIASRFEKAVTVTGKYQGSICPTRLPLPCNLHTSRRLSAATCCRARHWHAFRERIQAAGCCCGSLRHPAISPVIARERRQGV